MTIQENSLSKERFTMQDVLEFLKEHGEELGILCIQGKAMSRRDERSLRASNWASISTLRHRDQSLMAQKGRRYRHHKCRKRTSREQSGTLGTKNEILEGGVWSS